jgi:outer membrane protein TolC
MRARHGTAKTRHGGLRRAAVPLALIVALGWPPAAFAAAPPARGAAAAQGPVPPEAPAPAQAPAPQAPAPGAPPAAPAAPAPAGPVLTLTQAVQQALAQNPQVAAAQQAVVAAQANITTARSGLLPSISLTGTGGFGTNGSLSGVSQGVVGPASAPAGTGALSISGNLPLYDSGKTPAEVAAAQAALALAQATLRQTQQDIGLAAATDFFNVLSAERTATVRAALLTQAEQQLAQTEAKFRAGTAAQADVIQAQAQVAQAQVDLLTAQNQIATTKAALRSVLGLSAPGPVEVQEPSAPPLAPTVTADAAVAEALQNRPEIAEGTADVQASQANLTLAQIEAGLQLTLGVGAAYTPFSTNQFASNTGSYGITGTLSLPLFDAGRGAAAVTAAKANLSAAQARLSQTQLAVRQDAYQAYLNVVQGAATVTATAAAQKAADEALRVARGRYAAGVATIVEVTTSQATAAQADVNAVNALFAYETALATLQHALGRPIAAAI